MSRSKGFFLFLSIVFLAPLVALAEGIPGRVIIATDTVSGTMPSLLPEMPEREGSRASTVRVQKTVRPPPLASGREDPRAGRERIRETTAAFINHSGWEVPQVVEEAGKLSSPWAFKNPRDN